MGPAVSSFHRDSTFDAFLFAAIGEERNGMLLSVLSALARLDLDPWREAACLSRLPAPAATERLTSLLSSLPSSQIMTPAPITIVRLVGLLPQLARTEVWSLGATVKGTSKKSWPIAGYIVLAFLTLYAKQFLERSDAKAPTDARASSAANVPKPVATKA